jgi:hypothetical protein
MMKQHYGRLLDPRICNRPDPCRRAMANFPAKNWLQDMQNADRASADAIYLCAQRILESARILESKNPRILES